MVAAIDVFQVIASVTSIIMILSPIPTMIHIHKNQKTGHASIVPLVSMFANCHMSMMYGYLIQNYFPVFATFGIGDLMAIGYMLTFYRYTDDRKSANKILAIYGLVLGAATIYATIGGFGLLGQSRQAVGDTVGYMAIVATLVLYSSPFEKIGQVLKYRSAVFLPIHMVIAGTLTNGSWVIYTFLARDWILFAPNAFAFGFGVLQILLYVVFNPKTHPLPLDELELKPKDDLELGSAAVIVSPIPEAMGGDGRSSSPHYVPHASPLEPLQAAAPPS